jgi:mRNA interferase MazF
VSHEEAGNLVIERSVTREEVAEECALRKDSVALCSRIRTISTEHRITENLGSISHERLDEVDTALEYSLGLAEI